MTAFAIGTGRRCCIRCDVATLALADPQRVSVDAGIRSGHDIEVESLGDQFPAGLSHPLSTSGVSQQIEDGAGQSLPITLGDQNAIFTVPDHFPTAGHIGRDQRQTQRTGFKQHSRHSLAEVSWQDKQVTDGQ